MARKNSGTYNDPQDARQQQRRAARDAAYEEQPWRSKFADSPLFTSQNQDALDYVETARDASQQDWERTQRRTSWEQTQRRNLQAQEYNTAQQRRVQQYAAEQYAASQRAAQEEIVRRKAQQQAQQRRRAQQIEAQKKAQQEQAAWEQAQRRAAQERRAQQYAAQQKAQQERLAWKEAQEQAANQRRAEREAAQQKIGKDRWAKQYALQQREDEERAAQQQANRQRRLQRFAEEQSVQKQRDAYEKAMEAQRAQRKRAQNEILHDQPWRSKFADLEKTNQQTRIDIDDLQEQQREAQMRRTQQLKAQKAAAQMRSQQRQEQQRRMQLEEAKRRAMEHEAERQAALDETGWVADELQQQGAFQRQSGTYQQPAAYQQVQGQQHQPTQRQQRQPAQQQPAYQQPQLDPGQSGFWSQTQEQIRQRSAEPRPAWQQAQGQVAQQQPLISEEEFDEMIIEETAAAKPIGAADYSRDAYTGNNTQKESPFAALAGLAGIGGKIGDKVKSFRRTKSGEYINSEMSTVPQSRFSLKAAIVLAAVIAIVILLVVMNPLGCGKSTAQKSSSSASKTAATTTVRPSTPTPIIAESEGIQLHSAVASEELTEILIHNASYNYANEITTQLEEATNTDIIAAHGTGRVASEQPTGDNWMTGEFIRCFRSGNDGPVMSAIDCGGAVGTTVYAPVTGTVVLVKEYKLYDQIDDYRVHIRPEGNSNLDVVLIHLTEVKVHAGDKVTAGVTPIGKIRDVYQYLGDSLQLRAYTAEGDNGNHTHIQVNDVNNPNYHGLDDLKSGGSSTEGDAQITS